MSMSTANLRGVLAVKGKLSASQTARLRDEWRRADEGGGHRTIILDAGQKFEPAPLDNDLYALMCKAQDRFKAPHLRWDWCHRLPCPFRWGPNGAFFLLVAMLATYGLIVAAIQWAAP